MNDKQIERLNSYILQKTDFSKKTQDILDKLSKKKKREQKKDEK